MAVSGMVFLEHALQRIVLMLCMRELLFWAESALVHNALISFTPSTVTAMGGLGPFEIILIFLVILLIFGAKRIPEIARGLGKGIREFKDATNEISRELTMDDHSNRIQSPRQGEPMARPQQQYQAPAPPPQPESKPPAEEPSQQAS